MDSATLQQGREAFERRAWAESHRLLQAAGGDAPLAAEDLERLSIAAYLVGRDDDCQAVAARAHQTFLDRGDCEGAARTAFWLGFVLMGRSAIAPASGWFARAGRLLDEGQLDCVVRGYLLIPVAIGLGLVGLLGFLWAMKSGQFDDLDGAAQRILFDDPDEAEPRHPM